MNPRTIRLLVIASVLGVFLAGLVIGYGVRFYVENEVVVRSPSPSEQPRTRRPFGDIARRIERVGNDLGLSDAQRTTLTQILTEGERSAQAIIADVRPRLIAKRAEIEAEIAAVLTQAQRAHYREVVPGGLARPPGGRPDGPPTRERPHGGP
jgi:uncharacterized membrane protein